MWLVYLAINSVSGNIYIGKAADLFERIYQHIHATKIGSSTHFHNAIRKYGITAFEFFEIAKFAQEQDAFDYERHLIHQFRTNGQKLYNITNGGEGNSGWHHRKETIEFLSKINKGNKHGLGYRHTDDAKSLMSKQRLGNKHRLGIKHSQLVIAKISAAISGEKNPFFGKRHTAETKEKISGSNNGNAKLSKEDVKDIESLLDRGVIMSEVARRFNVSLQTISRIRKKETYAMERIEVSGK